MLPLGKLIFFIISIIFLVCSLIVNIFMMINEKDNNSESKLLKIINVVWFVGNILTIIYVLNTY